MANALALKGFLQVFRQSYWKILVNRDISLALKFEALCHVNGSLQFPCTALPIFLYPFLVMHGIDGFWVNAAAIVPSIEPFLSATVACYAKASGPHGQYRTLIERTTRLGLILPFFALKSGIMLFEIKATLEGLFSDDATFLTTPKDGVKGNPTHQATKSANQVVRRSTDDLVALAGICFGIHRLLFVLNYEIHFAFSSLFSVTIRVFNAMMALSLLLLNAVFLFEKHKDGPLLDPFRHATKTLVRAIKWPGFVPTFVTFSVYSYAATFATLELPVSRYFLVGTQTECYTCS